MQAVNPYLSLTGRIFIAAIFIITGFGKITGYEGTAAYMEAMGVPGALLPLVIALEIVGGLAIVVGWRTRIAAFLLAGFCLLSALIFHLDFADQSQFLSFWKNVGLAGGFLFLVVNGPGGLALDNRRARA